MYWLIKDNLATVFTGLCAKGAITSEIEIENLANIINGIYSPIVCIVNNIVAVNGVYICFGNYYTPKWDKMKMCYKLDDENFYYSVCTSNPVADTRGGR